MCHYADSQLNVTNDLNELVSVLGDTDYLVDEFLELRTAANTEEVFRMSRTRGSLSRILLLICQ